MYVHCWGGVGRTGTVVGCYLVRSGLSGDEALARIRQLRRNEATANRPSPETDEQRNMVRSWRAGEDADTTGAVYGQIAGAFYGEQGIPEAWRSKLAHRELIESFADRLFELGQTG